jgi:uncharacterized protein
VAGAAGEQVVTDHPDQHRFEITVDGERAGYAEYHRVGDNLDFTHTKIDDRFEGQGLGSKLIRGALDAAREQGAGVLPHCQFVKRFISQHDDYLDLVPEKRRRDFGLSP